MVTDDHRKFALVALARQHGMTGINMTFRTVSNLGRCELPKEAFEQVRMVWSEGRHGDPAQIELRTESVDRLSEKE